MAELKGFIAAYRNDWPAAAKWYHQYVETGKGGPPSWVDLAAAWHFLAVRSLDSQPFESSGAELRNPWQRLRATQYEGFSWHGATATALALHRLANDALADRFVAWAYRSDTLGVMKHNGFASRLEAAGLPAVQVESTDELDTLIDELFAFADALDADAQIDSL